MTGEPLNIVAWNIAHRDDAWWFLVDSRADIALLQEAGPPPGEVAAKIKTDAAPWQTGTSQRWRTAVVQISQQAQVHWLTVKPFVDACSGELGASRSGTIAAATITPRSGKPFIVASVYALWERPLGKRRPLYADASAHRLISDLSVFIDGTSAHDILIAGDLNVLFGYGEHGNRYWGARYQTIFDRMAALGLAFIGPQAPNGRQAEPWPDELPRASQNVPTYYTYRQTPATCTRQLDFVFASPALARRTRVKALNGADEWGPSDHCRVEIEVVDLAG